MHTFISQTTFLVTGYTMMKTNLKIYLKNVGNVIEIKGKNKLTESPHDPLLSVLGV